jgi:hypothetical protein
MIEERSAYLAANPDFTEDYEEDFDGEECERPDLDLCDADDETLSRGNLEIILEYSYISKSGVAALSFGANNPLRPGVTWTAR